MGVREDAEAAALDAMGTFRSGSVAIIVGWTAAVFRVLSRMGLNGHQQACAVDIVQAWGVLHPWLWGTPEWPRVLPPDEVAALRRYLDGVADAALGVRVARQFLPHYPADPSAVQEAVMAAQLYCEDAHEALGRVEELGTPTCDRDVLDGLAVHCRTLLRAVIGGQRMDEFDAAHAGIIAGLRGVVDLANAPET